MFLYMNIDHLPDDIIIYIKQYFMTNCKNCKRTIFEFDILNENINMEFIGYWYINGKIFVGKCKYCI